MRAMLRKMKHSRAFRDEQRALGLAAHQQHLQSATASALAHRAQAASHYYKNYRIRTIRRDPQRQSLFGGYYVGLGGGFYVP